MRAGVVAPQALALPFHVLGHLAADIARGRAAVCAVEPAIRAKTQAVGHRMRVLQAEATQVHLGIAIGHVVPVRIRVEEQVRWIHHPDAAIPRQGGGGDVQALDHGLLGVQLPVAIGILQHHHLVGPLGPFGGGSGTRSKTARRCWSYFTILSPAGNWYWR